MTEWNPDMDAARDEGQILGAIRVEHTNGARWWERHVIMYDDDACEMHPDYDHGWRFEDYDGWQPIPAPPDDDWLREALPQPPRKHTKEIEMKHARDDYDRIQDPSGKIPDEEPVFLIRGQDRAAPATLRMYAEIARLAGASNELVQATLNQAREMEVWQALCTSKIPDMPEKSQP